MCYCEVMNRTIIIGSHHYLLTNHSLEVLSALIVWSLFWKGMALWRAGRNNQPVWFIVMLIVNTLGILEIIYLLLFSKRDQTTED